MWTAFGFVAILWLLQNLARTRTPAHKPSVLKHRLSDRDTLVVVQNGSQTLWVGLYSEEVKEKEKEKEKTPDWLRAYYRN